MALLREAKPCVTKRVGLEVGKFSHRQGPTRLSIGRKNCGSTGREFDSDVQLSDEGENFVLSHNEHELGRSEE